MDFVAVQGVSKTYGQVLALDNISARFASGQVSAVLGENGAGKSTLTSVLVGLVKPDSGSVTVFGQPLALGDPVASKAAGIGMVHQHFTLVPSFTVLENLALAHLAPVTKHATMPPKSGRGGLMQLASPALELAQKLDWKLDLQAVTRTLPVGIQQRVEILRAVSSNERILILDEPTAVLSPDEIEDLFGIIRTLASEGKVVILIAHKLKEVRAVADTFLVLRKGKYIAEGQLKGVTDAQLSDWMVGETPDVPVRAGSSAGEVVLNVENLTVLGDRGEKAVNGVSLQVRVGEILGIGGVDGNGQVELAEAAVGVRPSSSGQVTRSAQPEQIAYIPQDRQRDGLAPQLSIEENLMIGLANREKISAGPFLSRAKLDQVAEQAVIRYQIKLGKVRDKASSLSGGNQQKVVIARELSGEPRLIVAVNPTRGLDIKASSAVREELVQASQNCAAVLLISTDLDELAELSTRQLFINSGQLSETLAASLQGTHS